MGNAASKVAPKAAAAAGRRQYPSTSSILNSATSTANAPSVNNAAATASPPPQAANPPSPSQVHPDPSQSPPSDTKSAHIDLDGRDPQFGASLRALGPAVAVDRNKGGTVAAGANTAAFPTSSRPPPAQQSQQQQNIFPPTGPNTSNPALMIVQARERIAKRFEEESENLGRGSFAGRTLVSAKDLSEAIRLRDETSLDAAQVEKQMRMQGGVLDQLGPRGMVGNASA